MVDGMKRRHREKKEALRLRLKERNVHKMSFLNVTALNAEKWRVFVVEEMGIDWHSERELVNELTERLRLCLKIHCNLLDDRMDDEWKWAEMLFAERLRGRNQGDDQKVNDSQV